MEEGYAVAGTWVNWVRERGTFDAALWKGDKLVSYGDAFPGGAHIPGARCRSCGIVVLDVAQTQ